MFKNLILFLKPRWVKYVNIAARSTAVHLHASHIPLQRNYLKVPSLFVILPKQIAVVTIFAADRKFCVD